MVGLFARNIEPPFEVGWTDVRSTSLCLPPPRKRSVVPMPSDKWIHPPGDQSPRKLTPLGDGLIFRESTRAHLVNGILELTA